MQTTAFELEAEAQSCLTDFPVKPYADIDAVQGADDLANSNQVPINYYDNEDGFWDEYIAAKQKRQFDAGFLSSRKWL